MNYADARILIVDDDRINREVLARQVGRSDFAVETAGTGEEALERIERDAFDLVLLDIVMPGLDGLEVLEILRRSHTPAQLPVILVSMKGQSEDIVKGLALGANDYVTKGTDPAVLLARIQTQLALKQGMEDLQQFAYVASHDLQEPLRTIGSYCQILHDRYRGQLDDQADQYIDFVVDGVSRMQVLIRDLLSYARLDTHGRPFESVDCNAVVDDTLQQLKSSVEDSQADVQRAELPVLMGDRSQLTQVFQNLISNAIKFRGNGPPKVAIGVEEGDGNWVFYVRDDGIGFDPSQHDQLYGMFKRLHTRDEYPGTGVGLALCRKVIQRHGGRIWAESEPGQGSTFYFTIPRPDG
ncbi:MAG: response regulator [Phycisphaerae bacterium]|nr:response regulator [Phycisphaerae bacterium]